MDKNIKLFNKREYKFNNIPELIFIETVMGCNLTCKMCPVPNSVEQMQGRKSAIMSMDTFDLILKQLPDDGPRKLYLNQMGEPLLNKNIFEFIKMAKNKGHFVAFTTNGTLLSTQLSEKLLNASLDQITFSLDGFKKETYESIRTGSNYEKVCHNIKELSRLKKELNKKIEIRIHCILSELTKNEISQMREYWKDIVDEFSTIPLDDWGGQFDLPENMGNLNPQSNSVDKKRYPCDMLWISLAISAEGNLMYCCHDYKLKSNLPNIKQMSLCKIWENLISSERERHVKQTINSEPCLNCHAWRSRLSNYKIENKIVGQLKKYLRKIKNVFNNAAAK